MASFSVDSNGQRIKTNILVSGFIKNIMNEHKLDIPDDIIGVCFLFWLIKTCDAWDQSLCHESVNIDGSCAMMSDDSECCTLFGTQTVESGVFKWYLKLATKIKWACIGIIKNEKRIIEDNKCNNEYGFEKGCGCFFLLSRSPIANGLLMFDGQEIVDYAANPCCDKGTIIEMTLNMDQKTIKYEVNDKHFHTTKIKSLSIEFGYRLAVTFINKGYGIELL